MSDMREAPGESPAPDGQSALDAPSALRLVVMLPTSELLSTTAEEVVVPTVGGPYGILPRHVDFTTSLTSGVFEYRTADGARHYVAADGGVAVKRGADLLVVTSQGAVGDDAAALRRAVLARFAAADERESHAREAGRRLEASLERGLWELRRRERDS